MNLRSLRNLFKKHQIRPSKRLGQNFLIDKKAIKKIIEGAKLSPNDTVLEIGPGIGNLTTELAPKVKKVIAIEKDQKMIKILKEVLKDFPQVEIIKEDVLKFNPKIYGLKPNTYKIVANIPYYLTSPLIRKFLETENQPKEMVLMVQKEVAQRISAKPPKMSLLAISIQFYAKAEILSYLSKKSFWPSPEVDSAIIKITPKRLIQSQELKNRFFKIVKAGFSQPRKQLINNLSKGLKIDRTMIKNWLFKNNIQPTQRAETLSTEDWLKLVKSYKI